MNINALSVGATGKSITLSGSSSDTTLPTDASGNTARYCKLASTTGAFVRWGLGAQTAVNTDLLVWPGDTVVVATQGANHVAGLQAATGGVLIVTPLEMGR